VKLVPDASMGPGLVAEAADGSVVVDSTLLARLSRLEARLAVELLNALPGEEKPS
jgi:vacuolar-type H+-ATPase subunit E/Vma4